MDSTETDQWQSEVRQTGRYQAAISFLFGRINYERTTRMPYSRRELNLSRMSQLLGLLGDPHRQLNTVHIAGTKGKGSTAAFLSAALQAAGLRCGSYTSPHLHFVEERFQIDGQACKPQALMEMIERIRPAVDRMDQRGEDSRPTYFEIATSIAFDLFLQQQVDVAILEVGLGGRLDSTNICHPLVSVITSISFDHTKQLGNTLGKIAREKAGIIKAGVPVVSGVTHPEPRKVIESIAAQCGSRLLQLDKDFFLDQFRPPRAPHERPQVDISGSSGFPLPDFNAVSLGMLGKHQAANATIALATAHLLPTELRPGAAAIREGFASTSCMARIEVVSRNPTIIVDAAHNVASVQALAEVLKESFPHPRRRLLLGTTKGKDVVGMLRALLPMFSDVVCARYENNPRGHAARKLCALAKKTSQQMGLAGQKISFCASPAAALAASREDCAPDELICVTGSFFIASEVRELILNGRV